jgi:hypothetical protein
MDSNPSDLHEQGKAVEQAIAPSTEQKVATIPFP